jgi:tRNA 2-thiouridine synthesizing protein A
MEHQNSLKTAKHWDAGDSGCGSLIIGLRHQFAPLTCGDSLQVIARNAGAPADLPAWCRITGHTLVSAAHPVYVIRKNGD